MGTLYSLVMMAAYAQGYVVVLIGTIVLLNLFILKLTYLSKAQKVEIIVKFYKQQKEKGTKETNAIFLNAVFTSWVSPCTVWSSKLKFLMVSSSTTLSVHLTNLISLYLIADSNMMNQIENPPILHCFNSHKNFSNISYNYYYFGNLTPKIIQICSQNDECFPLIRICSENEMHNTLMNTYIIPIGILLFFLSFSSSLCLQILSNYTKMHAFLRTFCQVCPKAYYWFLTDFIFNFNELEELLRKKVLNNIEKEVIKNVKFQASIQCVFTNHCEYFEGTEETKSIKIKLEELTKENDNESEKDISQVVWKLPPMHAAAHNNKFGLWCFMYIIGGEAGALNGQITSSINSIAKKFESHFNVLGNCNRASRYVIKTATEMYGKYSLHKATKLGDLQLMKILVANGNNINELDDYGHTALIISALEGHLDCIKYLVTHNADVNTKDNEGQTLLHISAEKGHLECIEYLIGNKDDVNAKDKKGQTPLHISVKEGHLECMKYLIENNADVNVKDKQSQTPLHKSASRGHLECIKYLIENKAAVNEKDEKGQTPLHISVKQGHLKCMQYLIENKADVNAKDNEDQTPLYTSAWKGLFEIMKCLIDNKADVNAKDKYDQTPIHLSALRGHLECCKYLFDNEADINAKDENGQTPLHISSWRGHLECSKYLIDNKADINVMDIKHNTPLHVVGEHSLAEYNKPIESALFLIRAGADLRVSNVHGETPLANKTVQQLIKSKPFFLKN